MLYLLQVIAYTGLFWVVYRLFAKDRLSATAARVYLLSVALVPLALPFLAWRWQLATPFPRPLVAYWGQTLQPAVVRASGGAATRTAVPWPVLAYAAVSLALLLRQAARYGSFARRFRGKVFEPYEGFRLYRGTGVGPASFGRSIFLPEADAPEAVLRHECAHLRLRHTADLVAIDLLRCLFWPNVFLPVVFRELKLVHEYAADKAAAAETPDYVSVLIASVQPAPAGGNP